MFFLNDLVRFFNSVLNFYISELKNEQSNGKKSTFCLSNDEINSFYKKNNFPYEISVKVLPYTFSLIINFKLIPVKK